MIYPSRLYEGRLILPLFVTSLPPCFVASFLSLAHQLLSSLRNLLLALFV
jgi:hypothetical protein